MRRVHGGAACRVARRSRPVLIGSSVYSQMFPRKAIVFAGEVSPLYLPMSPNLVTLPR